MAPVARGVHQGTVMRARPSRFPLWWGDVDETTWTRVRDAVLRDWRARSEHAATIEDAIVEAALAFGHGARSAYEHHNSWAALSAQLRIDWIGLGHCGTAAWDEIADIVKHAWSCAEATRVASATLPLG
jgi:hypothetical protein